MVKEYHCDIYLLVLGDKDSVHGASPFINKGLHRALNSWLRWWRAIRVKCPGIAQELERKAVPKVFRWSFAVCSIFVPFLFHEVFQYCFTKAQFIYNIER